MNKDLFADFSYTTAKEWLTRIAKDLKDQAPDEMRWSPDGDLTISPYVHAEHIEEISSSLSSFGKWSIGESFTVTDASASNAQIRTALNEGVESLHLSCIDTVDWETVLAGVELPYVHVGLNIIGERNRAIDNFKMYVERRFAFKDLHITIEGKNLSGVSPLRFYSAPFVAERISDALVMTIDAALTSSDWQPEKIIQRDLAVYVGMHYLVEIARLRALRILWSNVATGLGFSLSSEFAIEAHTIPCKAEDDPYTHMIKSTVMGLGAVLGGADRIYISPATGMKTETGFYKHIARNIHHILRYESKLPEVEDPIAGAYYVEQLTIDIVNNAWDVLVKR